MDQQLGPLERGGPLFVGRLEYAEQKQGHDQEPANTEPSSLKEAAVKEIKGFARVKFLPVKQEVASA